MFASKATLGTVHNIVPAISPGFAPLKGALADWTNLAGTVVFRASLLQATA